LGTKIYQSLGRRRIPSSYPSLGTKIINSMQNGKSKNMILN